MQAPVVTHSSFWLYPFMGGIESPREWESFKLVYNWIAIPSITIAADSPG
jgi:hypothetical protein